jgi:hypothetical protein
MHSKRNAFKPTNPQPALAIAPCSPKRRNTLCASPSGLLVSHVRLFLPFLGRFKRALPRLLTITAHHDSDLCAGLRDSDLPEAWVVDIIPFWSAAWGVVKVDWVSLSGRLEGSARPPGFLTGSRVRECLALLLDAKIFVD